MSVQALIDSLKNKWERLAQLDPLWAVWTDPKHKGRCWDPAAFYELGEREVARLLAELEKRRHSICFGSALDFGCGVGRLTRPLARRFGRAVGIDISPAMIEYAQSQTAEQNVQYILNSEPCLPLDAEFDFVLSRNTLQHMPPPLIELYLTELVRVLSDKGLLVFQMPATRICDGEDSAEWLPLGTAVDDDGYPRMDMYGIRKERIEEIIAQAKGRVIDVREDLTAVGWNGYTYLVRKAWE